MSICSLGRRVISASRREAFEISVIRRSSRLTSEVMTCLRRVAASGSFTRSSVSTAERMEVSGFFSSCATSAANCSLASIRSSSASVMLWIEVARSPISSVRCVSTGTSILSDAPERIRSAASARRRKGRAIPSVSSTEVMNAISTATPMNGTSAARSARMISSMSLASSTSTPTTAETRCTGIDTEITRLPRSENRWLADCPPRAAIPNSSSKLCERSASDERRGEKKSNAFPAHSERSRPVRASKPGSLSGGRAVTSTRSER